jgi:hypothetical protein
MTESVQEHNKLVAQLRAFTFEQWEQFDQAQIGVYPKEQQNIIYREKNLFFQKYYHPDGEGAEGQQPSDFASPEVGSAYECHIAELEAQQAAYMAKENPSFVFYHSFYEMIEDLPDKDFVACIRAACNYGLYGKKEEYKGNVKMFMSAVIPQIDANVKRRIAARLNGMKGGGQKGNKNAQKW